MCAELFVIFLSVDGFRCIAHHDAVCVLHQREIFRGYVGRNKVPARASIVLIVVTHTCGVGTTMPVPKDFLIFLQRNVVVSVLMGDFPCLSLRHFVAPAEEVRLTVPKTKIPPIVLIRIVGNPLLLSYRIDVIFTRNSTCCNEELTSFFYLISGTSFLRQIVELSIYSIVSADMVFAERRSFTI